MSDFFPTNQELILAAKPRLIEQLGQITTYLPQRDLNVTRVKLERELDDFGVAPARGSQYPSAPRTGVEFSEYKPFQWGEQITFDEQELLDARRIGTHGDPAEMDEYIGRQLGGLVNRMARAIKEHAWYALRTGIYRAIMLDGTEIKRGAQTVPSITLSTGWNLTGSATIVEDLLANKVVLQRKYGAKFDQSSHLVVNDQVMSWINGNNNPASILGRALAKSSETDGNAVVNNVLERYGLPKIIEVSDGFKTSSKGTVAPFIPDNEMIWIGNQNGSPSGLAVGVLMGTRNLENPGLRPGLFAEVIRSLTPPGS